MRLVALLCAGLAALANVAGAAAIAARERWSHTAISTMIAFSGGFMIAVAVVDMLPEALRSGGEAAAWVALAGYLAVHLTQHTLVPHFHFGEETHHISRATSHSALVGLLLHLFVDGVAIASAFATGGTIGVLVVIAIVLHKLPEGSTISSLMLAAGYTRGRALAGAAAMSLATVVGALVTELVASLAAYGLALSAGVTLYVAASNLVPEFQQKRGWRLPLAFFGGCVVFGVGQLLLGGL